MRALLSAALLAASPAAAQDAAIAPKTVRADVFPRVSARFPGGIVALPQLEVANLVGFRPVRMDLYLHRQRRGARPAVLWLHGGGWSRGDARTSGAYADWPAVLAALAARGYVVASLDYRLSGEARFPAQIQDVKAAIRFLRAHAGEYGVDPDRIYLWGGSAGAQLAALAATTCGEKDFAPEPSTGRLERAEMEAARARASRTSDCVQGLVAWYGPFDLETTIPANVEGLLGCRPRDCPGKVRAASPIRRVRPGAPPALLVHGTADTTVAPAQSEAMAARLRNVGTPVELVLIPGADHGWISATPAQTRAASLAALRRTFAFLDSLAFSRR